MLVTAAAFFFELTLLVAKRRGPFDGQGMALAVNYSGTSSEAGAIGTAVDWIAGVLTGTPGTVIATLAVAGVGLAMLQGRVTVRDGFRVVAGCFILFGAPAISRELLGYARWNGGPVSIEAEVSGAYFHPIPSEQDHFQSNIAAEPRKADPFDPSSILDIQGH